MYPTKPHFISVSPLIRHLIHPCLINYTSFASLFSSSLSCVPLSGIECPLLHVSPANLPMDLPSVWIY